MKSKLFPMFSAVRATALATITLTGLLPLAASATEYTWNGATNGTWNTTGTNWSGAPVDPWDLTNGPTNTANFNTASLAAVVSGTISTNGIKFSTAGALSGGTITLAGTAPVIDTPANGTISSGLAGSVGFTKTSAGTLILGGANTSYTGAVTLNAGTLQLNGTNTLGTSNAITFSGNNATLLINPGAVSLGAITVNSGVTGANISFTQNTTTVSHSAAGATLNGSPLTINQSNNTDNNWSQLTWTSKITGGTTAGTDALVFNNTSTVQNYFTTGGGAHDFTGNIHVKSGPIAVQGGTANGVVPDASLIILDSAGTWRWNGAAFTETVDGLSGSGAVTTNAGSYNLTINANNTANDAARIFSGSMANPASAVILGGTGTQEFSGASLNYSAATNLNKGTLKLTKTTAWNSNIVVGSSNSPTLQLNTPLLADPAWTFSKQITGTNASAKIEKIGQGTVILTPAASSSFAGSNTGALTVTGGKLYLNNTNFTTAPAVSIADTATFGGTATVGNVSVALGGTLEGGSGGTGTLTAADVSLPDVATLKGTLSTTAGFKSIAVNNLNLGGADASVTLDASGIGLVEGNTYDVLVSANVITKSGSAASVLSALKSNSRTLVPAVSGDGLKLQLTYSSAHWTGGGNASWDTASANNWTLGASPTLYVANDVVSFGNNPTSSLVSIDSADVSPASTSFDFTSESGTAYTLQGTKGIVTGSISKSGSGLLTITNTNNTTGAVNLNGGTVSISQTGGLGTGGITFAGATLGYTGGATSWSRNFTVNTGGGTLALTGNLTHSGTISGSAGLTKNGAGTLTLSTANPSFSGGMTLGGGPVIAGNSSAFGTGTLTLAGGSLTTSGTPTFANPVFVAASTTTNVYGYNGGANYPVFTGAFTGSGTFKNSNSGGGLGNAFISGDISGFTGTIWFDNVAGNSNNFQFTGTTAASYNGSQAKFYTTGSKTASGAGAMLVFSAGLTFKMGELAGTGGYIAPGNNTFEIGALGTDSSFDGVIANATGFTLAKVGTGKLTLTGTNLYTGTTTVNNGTLELTHPAAIASTTLAMGASNTPKLQLTAATVDWTFAKEISGGSTAATIEKTGPNAVTLIPTAGSSFAGSTTGALTVTGGKLYLNSAFTTAPAVSVASSATFGGTSTAGAVQVNASATLEGGKAGVGVLTADSVSFAGAGSLAVTPSLTTAPVEVTGALTTTGGANSITVALGNVPTVDGTYHLVHFGSYGGQIDNFKLPSAARSLVLQQNGNFIDLQVDSSNHPVWTGSGNGQWTAATQSPKNWKLSTGGAPTDFINLDSVEFPSIASSYDIYLTTSNVAPGSMTFNNDSPNDYTLNGTMDITSGGLVKNGTGRLTIYTSALTFPGGSTFNNGTVSIDSETQLGTGNRTFNGGTLEYAGVNETWTRDTIVAGGGGILDVPFNVTVTHNGVLSGAGVLTKAGEGTLALPYLSGTISNAFAITDGTLKLSYGTGNVTYNGAITGTAPGILRLEGDGASATTGLTLAGNCTFAGEVHIAGKRIFLDSPTANSALSGSKIIVKTGTWPWHGLTLNRDEQIGNSSVLRFENTNDAYDFRLNGHSETLGGLECPAGNSAIVENAGYDNTTNNDNNIPAGTLVVNPAGAAQHFFQGGLRNQNGGSGNGSLSFGVTGSGTQVLSGTGIVYTGTTTITSGTLELRNTTSFASSAVTANGGTLLINNTTGSGTGSTTAININGGATLAGAGSVGGTTTIAAGGTVAPGNGDIGTLTANNVGFSGTCQIEIGDTTSDLLTVTGSLTTSGTPTIVLSTVGTPTANEYIIVNYPVSFAGTLPTVSGVPSGYAVNTATAGVIKLVSTAGGYSAWAASWTSPSLSDPSPEGDPDNDGISNLMEYVLGGDPRVSSTEFLPTQEVVSGNLVIHYKRSDASEADTTQVGQWSTSLGTWNNITPVLVNENLTDPDDMSVTIPMSNEANGKLFGRIKITQP